jgi:hypothetical protein
LVLSFQSNKSVSGVLPLRLSEIDVLEIQGNLQQLEDFVNLGDLSMLITDLAFAYLMSAIPLENVRSFPSTASLNQTNDFINSHGIVSF